jgi:membrane associated rhomboid family serine protease
LRAAAASANLRTQDNVNEYSYQDEQQQPVMWLREFPVYAAYLLVIVFVASMIATAVLLAANLEGVLAWLPFSSTQVLRGQAWRVATYGLLNPPSVGFAFNMAMIVWFGREVEKFLGRGKFLGLYACLYFLPALLLIPLGLVLPTQLSGESGAMAVFVAFATIYPDTAVFFGMLSKWVAAILVGIYSLMALAYHDWSMGISLWITTGFAFVFVRHHQGLLGLPRLRLFRPGPRPREPLAIEGGRARAANPGKERPMAEVDALLDKIALSGMASLTPKERAKLDSARDYLARKASGR